MAIAGCSQLLSLDWRDRELQIATGLGIFSMVSVAVSVLHTRPALRPQYNLMNQLVAVSYACSLLYWIVSFAQKEAERREFTPQSIIFSWPWPVPHEATRVALTDRTANKDRNSRN